MVAVEKGHVWLATTKKLKGRKKKKKNQSKETLIRGRGPSQATDMKKILRQYDTQNKKSMMAIEEIN